MKNIVDLVMWISSILDEGYARYDSEENEIVVRDLDGNDIYWFNLDDFEL